MAQGRGSSVPIMLMVLLCVLVLYSDWPNGKTFHVKDILYFKYDPKLHNVVIVDEEGYNSCSPKPGSKTLQSGNDKITLGPAPGKNFYICSIPGHCNNGMKIAITSYI